jgi:Tfp pilus assembly protein PilF
LAVAASSLFVAVFLLYLPAAWHGFLLYDDFDYAANPAVQGGLSPGAVAWAFSSFHETYWIPVTWLSLMLDRTLFGPGPAGFHLTNILLHAANAGLLVVLLARLTGRLLPALLVAALFAGHPQRVESVVWITERKDVLSMLFFLLALLAYLGHARRPSTQRLLSVALLGAVGLMAKPILVTAPLLLLIFDFWPLGRWQPGARQWRGTAVALVWEKIPIFLLSLFFAGLTYASQTAGGSIIKASLIPLGTRLTNVPPHYLFYLQKTLWPAHLSPHYAPDELGTVLQSAAAALALIAATAVILRLSRRRGYLATGWLWWLLSLLPVIGLVRAGSQTVADRFTYIPSLGLALTATGWLAGLQGDVTVIRRRMLPPVLILLGACVVLTVRQTRLWADPVQLLSQATLVAPANAAAHLMLGLAYAARGAEDEALASYRRAEELDPASGLLQGNLGALLFARGEYTAAEGHFREAVRLEPRNSSHLINLGKLLVLKGRLEEAERLLQQAVNIAPDNSSARLNLGLTKARAGRAAEAAADFRVAAVLDPGSLAAALNLGIALAESGQAAAARHAFEAVLTKWPEHPEARRYLSSLPEPDGRVFAR